MKTVFETGGPNPFTKGQEMIKVEQHEDKKALFKVTYGLQVRDRLRYYQAGEELGACILHHLACKSVVNNEGL